MMDLASGLNRHVENPNGVLPTFPTLDLFSHMFSSWSYDHMIMVLSIDADNSLISFPLFYFNLIFNLSLNLNLQMELKVTN